MDVRKFLLVVVLPGSCVGPFNSRHLIQENNKINGISVYKIL